MTTALQRIESATPAQFTDDQVDLIKRTICKGASNDQLALFMATAKRLGLDPFARQIFAVKRGQDITIQVSIDGFRLVADRTGCYAPGRPTEYSETADGKLIAATAYVKKLAGGTWHEVGETSYLSEYQQSSNHLWKSMPRVMLAKTAEARALRRAFPAELSGVYSPDEMDQADEPRPVEPTRMERRKRIAGAALPSEAEPVIDAEYSQEEPPAERPALTDEQLIWWRQKLQLAASVSPDALRELVTGEMSQMTEPQRRLLRPDVAAAKSAAARRYAERLQVQAQSEPMGPSVGPAAAGEVDQSARGQDVVDA